MRCFDLNSPVLYAVRLVLHNLLHVLVKKQFQDQRHIVTVKKKLGQKLKLQDI